MNLPAAIEAFRALWLNSASPLGRRGRGAKHRSTRPSQILHLELRQLLTATTGAELSPSAAVTPAAVNFPPVIQPKDFLISENSADGAFIGTVKATDPDTTQTLTFSITAGNTKNAFAIDAQTGVLTVNSSAALDFETTPQFNLTIKAADNGNPALFATAPVTVFLRNINDAPVVTSQALTIPENLAKGSLVTTMQAHDPDAGQSLTYSIVAGNTKGTFAINPATGRITVNNPALLDIEQVHTPFNLSVVATDNGSPALASSGQVIIYLSDVNEGPPIINQQNFLISENSLNKAFIGTITATDVDTGQPHRFAITGGNTNNAFAIDPVTGVLSVNNSAALDYEVTDRFQLTITATETTVGGQSGSGLAIVFLKDVNEFAPVVPAPQTIKLAENSSVGTVVATVKATDPDRGQTLSYAITGGNTSNSFKINESTGVITVANPTALDYENRPPYDLSITVTDNIAPSKSSVAKVKVFLTDVNDAPSLYDATVEIAENSPVDTLVLDYKIVAKDQDPSQTLTYAITSGNTKEAFKIDAATGLITVKTPAAIDFEKNAAITLTISVTDDGTPSRTSSAKLVVKLTNVNEAPVLLPQTFAVKTASKFGTVVGTVKSSDPDAGQTRSYSIVSGNGILNNTFKIDAATGVLTVNNALRLLNDGQFNLVVRVTDSGNPALSTTATVTVNVNATGTLTGARSIDLAPRRESSNRLLTTLKRSGSV